MNQRSIWIIVLIIAVILSGVMIILTNATTLSEKAFKPQPDAFMTNVNAVNMNKNGTIQSQLYSPEMVHFPLNNSTDITMPHLVFYSKKGSPWNLTSDKGKANFGINQIILWDHVHVHRKKSKNNGQLDLKTSELTVYPHLQFATTNRNVVLKQLESISHSKGLRANLKTGVLKLIDQAQGVYDPSQDHKE